MTDTDRVRRYRSVSAALARHSDRRLAELVAAAPLLGSGIGGTTASFEIEGVPVFVKRIALTDLERRPGNVLSTANLFGLPTYCQYGVVSFGFGVWREVVANAMTTGWVLERRCGAFPLMYHWRVLAGPPPREPSELQAAELGRAIEHGPPALRERLAALAGASASVVLFLEHFPGTLHDWLRDRLSDPEGFAAACAMAERYLRTGVSFMNANGLLHFDAHFRNILTDGRRLYLADLGLATSPRFALSAAERTFVADNRTHDGCYAVTALVNWLVSGVAGLRDPGQRNAYIRRCAQGGTPPGVGPGVAAVIARYAPIAVVVNEFYWALFDGRRGTPYPAGEIERVCAETGFEPILPGAPDEGSPAG